MTNRKSYNSVIFLSTLCLGLILVGATPYLSSQFALTRIDEIPIVEDLDQLPEDDSDFQSLFISLLKEIRKESRNQKISLPLLSDFNYSHEVLREDTGTSSSTKTNFADRNLTILLHTFLEKKVIPVGFSLSDKDEKYRTSKVELNFGTSDVILQLSFAADNPENLSNFLKRKYLTKKENVNNLLLNELYKNTVVSSQNNQVFIVTRLPRASIDSLLKQ